MRIHCNLFFEVRMPCYALAMPEKFAHLSPKNQYLDHNFYLFLCIFVEPGNPAHFSSVSVACFYFISPKQTEIDEAVM